jgi:hypothetical protein
VGLLVTRLCHRPWQVRRRAYGRYPTQRDQRGDQPPDTTNPLMWVDFHSMW